ncbi:HPP family protein [Epilithonimonas sp.]|uniref:HPP family protein n=1 Tax=Epilithonimonas sp. TaxID=2894511 RepID=UPI00390C6AAC
MSALVGVTVFKFLPEILWLNASVAVASSIVVMQVTKTMHPPGGATALIAVLPSDKIQELGYWYALSPVLSGALILLIVALIFNNIPKGRKYPHRIRQSKYVHMRRMMKNKD